jgi:hypothetical protein
MGVRTVAIDNKTDTSQDWRLTDIGMFVPASALNCRTGVTVMPALTGTGSLSCQISPFSAVIDGTSNSLQGGYRVTLDAAATVNITTGSAQSRIDLIALQIQDNTWDSSGQHQGTIVYTAGTPGSGSAPATPANSIALFTIAVPASASSLNFATAQAAVFPFTAAAGGIVPVRNNNDKPAVANAVQYRHRLDVAGTAGTTSPLEWSTDGVTWRPVFDASVVPTSTSSAITAGIANAFGAWVNLANLNTTNFSVAIPVQWRSAPGNKFEFRGELESQTTIATGTNIWNSGGGPVPATSTRSMAMAPIFGTAIALIVTNSGIGYVQCQTSGPIAAGQGFCLDGCWCSSN